MVTPVDAVQQARAALCRVGAHVLPAATVRARLGLGGSRWTGFAAHWEQLVPDRYALGSGTHRRRRYGRFLLDRGGAQPLPHTSFRQPLDTNRLFPDGERDFEPLTAGFATAPALARLLALLREIAEGIAEADRWLVHAHPLRVLGDADSRGDATPEGHHQDGVTLVSSLLVARANATGGESRVFAPDGGRLLSAILREPGELMVGDDRRTWHSVTSIEPIAPGAPAQRDVLVVTLTAC